MANTTGVYPVYDNQFKIDKTGGDGKTESNLVTIADMESFSVSIDGNIEEWKPYEQQGWTRRMLTGKAMTIAVSGKRNVGDAGNDYVASLALKTGTAATTTMVWNFPDGSCLIIRGIVNVTEWGAGDSTTVAPLAWEFVSDGKPEYVEAAA